MSTKKVIPSGRENNFNRYHSFLVSFLSFSPNCVGETYLGISLIEMPLSAIDLIALELDGWVFFVSSPCSLVVMRLYLFFGGVEQGFWAFRFTLGIEEDPISMLMTSSSTHVCRMGDPARSKSQLCRECIPCCTLQSSQCNQTFTPYLSHPLLLLH